MPKSVFIIKESMSAVAPRNLVNFDNPLEKGRREVHEDGKINVLFVPRDLDFSYLFGPGVDEEGFHQKNPFITEGGL